MSDMIQQLGAVLAQRKQADAESSYVASLYAGGMEKILKKVGEETAEFIMAATAGSEDQIVYEAADVWFHMLVALAQRDIPAERVIEELQRRFGLSGHAEKAGRSA